MKPKSKRNGKSARYLRTSSVIAKRTFSIILMISTILFSAKTSKKSNVKRKPKPVHTL